MANPDIAVLISATGFIVVMIVVFCWSCAQMRRKQQRVTHGGAVFVLASDMNRLPVGPPAQPSPPPAYPGYSQHDRYSPPPTYSVAVSQEALTPAHSTQQSHVTR